MIHMFQRNEQKILTEYTRTLSLSLSVIIIIIIFIMSVEVTSLNKTDNRINYK